MVVAKKEVCPGCTRLVAKRVRRGKAYHVHNCPHGVPCIFGRPGLGGHGMNGPARGGPYYCPACVIAYARHKGRT
jgi:hypothetical protein